MPGPGQVLIKTHLAALNPADRYLSEGEYPARPAYPHILGRDGVGTVLAVGAGVDGLSVGQNALLLRSEIGVNLPGMFAEQCLIPAESLVTVPPEWSAEQAAAAPLVYLTAYQAMTQWQDLPKSGVVLISGASGGVGIAAIHLARALGLTPVALSRNADKTPALIAEGAATVLNPQDKTWTDQLYKAHGKRPVVLAIDNIGGSLFPTLIDTLSQNARVSCIGQLAGPVPNFSPATLFFRRIQVRGTSVGAYTPAEARTAWSEIVRLLTTSNKRPLVDSTHPFADLPTAFARLAEGPLGKVLIRVS